MTPTSSKAGPLPILQCETPKAWETWLDQHHATTSGVWLRLAKKASGDRSVTYQEALEVALCYGWIDGQKKGYDDRSWLQKFTPRSARSLWSKVNKEKVQQLISNGLMKPAGLKAIERAQQNGQWEAAYEAQSRATIPSDLQEALDQNPKAKDFYMTLDSRNRYAILFRVQTAKKAETRARRIQQFVSMLEKQEKLYS